jgi:FlaA1/EpsC-like NDP-sugar epimerase
MSAERYFIQMESVAACVLRMVQGGDNGRIYIPKMETKNIYKLAMEYTGCEAGDIEIMGLRGGEHMFERLYSQSEAKRLCDKGDYYVI